MTTITHLDSEKTCGTTVERLWHNCGKMWKTLSLQPFPFPVSDEKRVSARPAGPIKRERRTAGGEAGFLVDIVKTPLPIDLPTGSNNIRVLFVDDHNDLRAANLELSRLNSRQGRCNSDVNKLTSSRSPGLIQFYWKHLILPECR